jgi:hypothetical protein
MEELYLTSKKSPETPLFSPVSSPFFSLAAGFPQFPRQKLGVLHGFLCGILRTALI